MPRRERSELVKSVSIVTGASKRTVQSWFAGERKPVGRNRTRILKLFPDLAEQWGLRVKARKLTT